MSGMLRALGLFGTLTRRQRPHNLLMRSEEFSNSYWVKSDSTVTPNATSGPFANTQAFKLVEGSLSGAKRMQASATGSGGAAFTSSVYVKGSERNVAIIALDTTANSGFGIIYNPATGATSGAAFNFNGGVFQSTSVESIGDGWYRISVTGVCSAAGANIALRVELRNGTNANYTGDGTSGIFIWGAQLNQGDLQPYRPTVGAAV